MALIEDIFAENILDEPDELEQVEDEDINQIHEVQANDDQSNDEEDKENENKDGDKKEIKKKRVVSQRPKLNILRLMNTKNGLTAIEKIFEKVKLKGKGYEREDLNLIMRNMEIWAHQLFPALQFDDCLGKLEKLGHNKSVMTYMTKIRLGMEDEVPRADEKVEEQDSDDEVKPDASNSAFDQLIKSQNTQNNHLQARSSLTAEQRERMIRNRLIAEQRRLARLKARQEQQQNQLQEQGVSSDNTMEIVNEDSEDIIGTVSRQEQQNQLQEEETTSCNTMDFVSEVSEQVNDNITTEEMENHLQGKGILSNTMEIESEGSGNLNSTIARQEQQNQINDEISTVSTLDFRSEESEGINEKQNQLQEKETSFSNTVEMMSEESEPNVIGNDVVKDVSMSTVSVEEETTAKDILKSQSVLHENYVSVNANTEEIVFDEKDTSDVSATLNE